MNVTTNTTINAVATFTSEFTIRFTRRPFLRIADRVDAIINRVMNGTPVTVNGTDYTFSMVEVRDVELVRQGNFWTGNTYRATFRGQCSY